VTTDGTTQHVAILGHEVPVPLTVESCSNVALVFAADLGRVQALIDYSGLKVRPDYGGAASVTIAAVRYNASDLGAYNEIAVAVDVQHADEPLSSSVAFIHRLPVDSDLSCEAGRQIWGFPKWVTRIGYEQMHSVVTAVLNEDGEDVIRLRVPLQGSLIPMQETSIYSYSWRDGILRRTHAIMKNSTILVQPQGGELFLGQRHPMAKELRAIGLPRESVCSITVARGSSRWEAAEEMPRTK